MTRSYVSRRVAPPLIATGIATAIATGALFAATLPAQAGTQVSVKPWGFSTTPIVVVSEDGKSWTKVKNTPLHLGVTVGIGKTDELVIGYRLRQGWLGQNESGTWLYNKFFSNYVARVDKNLTIYGNTAHFKPSERTKFIKACNAKLLNGAKITETQKFFSTAQVQMFANFTSNVSGKGNVGGMAGKYGNGSANVQVICKRVLKGAPDLAAKEPKILKVKSLELFRSTFSHAYTKPNMATKCKKLRLLVRVKTNKAGPTQVKLWTKIGDKPMTSKVIDLWSKFSGPGQYKAEYKEWISISKTSFAQAKAEETNNTFGKQTGWKSIMLKCSPAAGGFASTPQNNNAGQANTQPKAPVKVFIAPAQKKSKRPFARPNKKVAPVKRVVCYGGKISKGHCFCPARTKKIKIGRNAYRCMRRVVTPKRVAPKRVGRVVKTRPVAPANRPLKVKRRVLR